MHRASVVRSAQSLPIIEGHRSIMIIVSYITNTLFSDNFRTIYEKTWFSGDHSQLLVSKSSHVNVLLYLYLYAAYIARRHWLRYAEILHQVVTLTKNRDLRTLRAIIIILKSEATYARKSDRSFSIIKYLVISVTNIIARFVPLRL